MALNKDDENQRLFFRVKGNYDEPPYTTMTFTIGSVHIAERQAVVPKIEYSPEVLELSLKEIDEMTRTEKAEKKTTEKDKAEEFLKMFLKDSQKRQREIMEAAEKLGISKTTLERAKWDLGIKSVQVGKKGEKGHWEWIPPWLQKNE